MIVDEVFTTLNRERIRRKYHISESDAERLRGLLEHETASAPVTHDVHGVATHPEDELILAIAVSAKVHYLATGDAQLQ